MKAVSWIALIFFAFELSACQQQDIDQKQTGNHDPIKILFIGNSLTYTNNLPSLVVKAGKVKDVAIKTEMIAYPNYALEDHWNEGKIQKQIEKGGFDYVVVQQGPSSQSEGREMLLSYGAKVAAICKKADARLVFFMVWPAKVNLHMFDGVITNYRDAAVNTQSVLCPVGETWKKHFDATGDFSYYGEDGFHPSQKGSEVAAKIIADALLDYADTEKQ